MKKLFFVLLCAGAMLCSCKSVITTTNVVNPATNVESRTTATLDVSSTRISYTYVPTAQTRKTGFKNILQTAIEEALKANGNADVLVDLKYTFTGKHFFFFDKIESITITGFPATYTQFKTMRLVGVDANGNAVYESSK